MNRQPVMRDERYYAIENASYKIGHTIFTFGLLLLIFIRAILYQESSWDLFALVILANLAATVYQARQKIIAFSWKWVIFFFASMLLAAIGTYFAVSLF
jgi:hypothetical protein